MLSVVSVLTVALQMGPETGPQMQPAPNPVIGLFTGGVGAFLTTLIVGAILVAVAPDFTDRKIATLVNSPLGSFVYGLVALLALVVVILLLVVTVIGIIVAVPLALLAYVLWAVGAAVAYLAIGERLVGREDGWTKPLLVGAVINGALTLTGVGGIVTFAIGAAGFGAVLRGILG